MSALLNFVLRYVVPIARAIAPSWVAEVFVNIAVKKERGRRPHPFSLWTGMGDGCTARRRYGGDRQAVAGACARRPPPARSGVRVDVRPFAPSGYVAWPSLADRRYTGRHLPPCDASFVEGLPPVDDAARTLFTRAEGQFIPCPKSTALFCFFAQWFTDSFLRTDPLDRRRNTSNHEIDYCQIYGLDERTTFALRERQGGRMRLENNLLPRLTGADGLVRAEFHDLGYIRNDTPDPRNDPPGTRLRGALGRSLPEAAELPRWSRMYAAGLERGNSTILYTAMSTMAVREHNRVAAALEARHPHWDDDRLFETARIVMVRNVLQIVVEDYINHIAGGFGFTLDRSFAERQTWYRSNRISLEFNLLYRWHSLVPDSLTIDGTTYPHTDYRFNNGLLEQHGIERCIDAASVQPAGRIGLYNTPAFLWRAEMASLDMARTFRLQPFVKYCERFSRRPPTSIAELVRGDARATADLTRLYGTIDQVELPVGLIAEARDKGEEDAVLPPLVRSMVAVDAFTHIFTNPLLAAQVHDAAFEGAASDVGELTTNTGGVVGLIKRNALPGTTPQAAFEVR